MACGAVGLIQLGLAWRFRGRLRRSQAPFPAELPFVSVIVPCKGRPRGFEGNIASLLDQDYSGGREYLFVTPSESDPAYPALRGAVEGAPRARVLCSGAAPSGSSEKALNLLAGLRAADPGSEALLFADSDLRVRRDWMARMLEPLGDPRVGISTAVMAYLPEEPDFASWMRLSWMGYALPAFEPMGLAASQSLAVRRGDFEALGIRDLWRVSVSDDLAMAARFRQAGKRVSLAAGATPVSREPCGLSDALRLFGRWMTLLRFYDRRAWLLGALLVAFKFLVLLRALQAPLCWPLLALWLGCDMAYLGIVFGGLQEALPEIFAAGGAAYRHVPIRAVLAAPIVVAAYGLTYVYSLLSREVAWAGYTYRLKGALRVEAVAGEEEAGKALSSRLLRLGLVGAAGALSGMGYWPGSWGVLAWLILIPLLWVIEEETPAASFFWGWWYGGVLCAAGIPWLLDFLRRFLDVSFAEAACWFAAVCAYHGLSWALACWAARALAEAFRLRWGLEPSAALAAAFVPAMVAAEGYFPALFPSGLADTQYFHLPAVQMIEISGMAGLAWLVAGFNAAAYAALRSWGPSGPGRVRAAILAGLAAVLLVNDWWGQRRMDRIDAEVSRRMAAGRSLGVGIVQAPLPSDLSRPPGRFAQNLPLYNELTAQALAGGGLDLVIWPESTYAGLVEYGSEAGAAEIAGRPLAEALAADIPHPVPLLLSAVGKSSEGEHNISILTGPFREPWGIAEKGHLIAFGEYMPLGKLLPFLRALSPRTAGLTPGRRQHLLWGVEGAGLGVLICYEDLMADVARRHVLMGANLLVNQTNDAWFDRGMAPEQHLRLSALRAVETRRYLLRAVTSGVSAVVSPSGRVLSRIPARAQGVIVEKVALMDLRTFGAAAGRAFYHLAGLVLAGAWFCCRRGRSSRGASWESPNPA